MKIYQIIFFVNLEQRLWQVDKWLLSLGQSLLNEVNYPDISDPHQGCCHWFPGTFNQNLINVDDTLEEGSHRAPKHRDNSRRSG